jgi:hypothetical protein
VQTDKDSRHIVASPQNTHEAEGGESDLTLLPSLLQDEINIAHAHENKQFVMFLASEGRIGSLASFPEHGFVLQTVAEGVLRCLLVQRDPETLLNLAIFAETVQSVGCIIQIAPYAVLVSPEGFIFALTHDPQDSLKAGAKESKSPSETQDLYGVEVA